MHKSLCDKAAPMKPAAPVTRILCKSNHSLSEKISNAIIPVIIFYHNGGIYLSWQNFVSAAVADLWQEMQ